MEKQREYDPFRKRELVTIRQFCPYCGMEADLFHIIKCENKFTSSSFLKEKEEETNEKVS